MLLISLFPAIMFVLTGNVRLRTVPPLPLARRNPETRGGMDIERPWADTGPVSGPDGIPTANLTLPSIQAMSSRSLPRRTQMTICSSYRCTGRTTQA